MTTIDAATSSSNVYAAGSLTGATGLSPEALLAYCQTQLNGLDGEIKNSIDRQNLELQEREAAETAQGALESYGDNGPQDQAGLQTCVDALTKAAASLPQGDPVAAELLSLRDSMAKQYGLTQATPGRALTPDEQAQLAAAQAVVNNPSPTSVFGGSSGPSVFSGTLAPQFAAAQQTVDKLTAIQNGTPAGYDDSKKPKNDEWKGTCQTLSNYVGDIKSNAEIQMLSLQDLVSQRQQAVSLATSMMSKEDTSLEQLAHLGQG
jgi:hypothetical protein